MACYHPLSAFDTGWTTKNGKTKYLIRPEGTMRTNFHGRMLYDVTFIPCGKCIGCRLDYASTWAKRLMLEKSLYPDDQCHFITLTYDDEHLNSFALDKRDWQLFMKKLRKHFYPQKIRFFMCGEYGSTTFRKHYHAILFGLKLDDLKPIHKLDPNGLKTSDTVRNIWNKGNISIGEVNLKTCGYVAQYVLKKQTYKKDEKPSDLIQQPFTLMSRAPGIGGDAFDLSWYENYEIILDGKTFKPGKYFDKIFTDMGYSTDAFKVYNDIRIEKKFNTPKGFFGDLHDAEMNKINETKILKERNRFDG